MASYATVQDVQNRILRDLSEDEQSVCTSLLADAGAIIDVFNSSASNDVKLIVSCRMVIRALGDGNSSGVPMGASQGSMSGLGYSSSWTIGSGGAVGELYLSKLDKQTLGCGNKIGSYSPVEELAHMESGL